MQEKKLDGNTYCRLLRGGYRKLREHAAGFAVRGDLCNKLARIRSDPLYEIKISLPVMGAENTNFYSDDPGRVVFFDLLGRPKEGERMKIVCAPSAFFIRFISGARIVSDLRGVVAAMDPDPNFFRDFAPYGVTIM